MKRSQSLLLASLVAVAALSACGKKDEPPAVAAPAPAEVTPPAAPATTPAPGASSAPDAAEAAKKNAETPPAKP